MAGMTGGPRRRKYLNLEADLKRPRANPKRVEQKKKEAAKSKIRKGMKTRKQDALKNFLNYDDIRSATRKGSRKA